MSGHDPLNGLRSELQALPARHRRAVLNALTPAERSQVISLLTPPERPLAPRADSATISDDGLLDGYSALFANRLQGARSDDSQSGKRSKMTPAARRHLLASAEALREQRRAAQPSVKPRGRSLLNVLGSWFANGAAAG